MQPYPTIQNYGYNPYLMNGLNQNNFQGMQPQMPTQTQPMQMSGRFVGDFNEVTVNDVSMNNPSVFVKNDRSEIQIREWSPNGQIVLTSYLPHTDKNSSEMDKLSNETQKSKFDAKSEVLDPLFERLEQLEEKIDKLTRPTRAKKEVADE